MSNKRISQMGRERENAVRRLSLNFFVADTRTATVRSEDCIVHLLLTCRSRPHVDINYLTSEGNYTVSHRNRSRIKATKDYRYIDNETESHPTITIRMRSSYNKIITSTVMKTITNGQRRPYRPCEVEAVWRMTFLPTWSPFRLSPSYSSL